MDETKEIIKEQLKNIPESLRKYVLGSVWSENISKIGRQLNLAEDQSVSLENEVLFVLICLEPPKDFAENIKREAGLDENTARRVADMVNGSVFAPVMKDIKGVWENIPKEESTSVAPQPPPEPPIKSYDSFEQTILRQAQAMRPAVAAPKLGYGEAKPALNPTSANPSPTGADPYREPVK